MLLEHEGRRPRIDDSAYVAPTAVVCGDVTIGPDCRVLFGAVLTAESGPVVLGSRCIVMEQAVLLPDAVVPIGWVALGDPAQILPPTEHERISAALESLNFSRSVFGLDPAPPGQTNMPERTRRYARALGRHLQDRILDRHASPDF